MAGPGLQPSPNLLNSIPGKLSLRSSWWAHLSPQYMKLHSRLPPSLLSAIKDVISSNVIGKSITYLIFFYRSLLHQGLYLVFNILPLKRCFGHLMAVFWGSVWVNLSVYMSLLHPWPVCASACKSAAPGCRRKYRSRTEPGESLEGSNHLSSIICSSRK